MIVLLRHVLENAALYMGMHAEGNSLAGSGPFQLGMLNFFAVSPRSRGL
jgi:hypothetical protein